jgi:rod shape-determining protein MreC
MARLRFQSDTKRRTRTILLVLLFLFVLIFGRSLLFGVLHIIQKPFVVSGTFLASKYEKVVDPFIIKPGEIENLKNRVADLAIDQAEFSRLSEENQQLKSELGFIKRAGHNALVSSIISRTSSLEKTTFAIDVGENQGMVKGSAVVIENGMYIGKVTSVGKNQSVVTATTDKESATAVSLLNKSKTIGIAEGKSGNLIELKFIPADEEVSVNDLVVTSGLEQNVPFGLLVGIVNTVRPDPQAPFQEAVLEPLVDVRKHNHVIVLLPKSHE